MPDDPIAAFARIENPAGDQLGMKIVSADRETGRSRVSFDIGRQHCNPLGSVQGGFVAAMLDEAMAVAAIAKSDVPISVPTLDLRTSYLAAARPGRLYGEGHVLKMGRTICFLEGRLTDADGKLLATAQATAKVAPLPRSDAAE